MFPGGMRGGSHSLQCLEASYPKRKLATMYVLLKLLPSVDKTLGHSQPCVLLIHIPSSISYLKSLTRDRGNVAIHLLEAASTFSKCWKRRKRGNVTRAATFELRASVARTLAQSLLDRGDSKSLSAAEIRGFRRELSARGRVTSRLPRVTDRLGVTISSGGAAGGTVEGREY